jgi:PhnB protein
MTSIAPWLSMKNATEALAYYKAAFGAIELERLEDEAGDVVIAQLSIEGADFWIQTDAESSPDALNGRFVRVASVTEGYGWRIGRVADPSGHHWEIGMRLAT